MNFDPRKGIQEMQKIVFGVAAIFMALTFLTYFAGPLMVFIGLCAGIGFVLRLLKGRFTRL